jgi:hypothetical protein
MVYGEENLGNTETYVKQMLEFIKNDDDLIIITNDDNSLDERCVEIFYTYGKKYPDRDFFASKSGGFSCFCFRKRGFSKVGRFDENFYPAYFEDNDYHYRMKLLGVQYMPVDIEVYEKGFNGKESNTMFGETTTDEDKDIIQLGFRLNQKLYVRKWGGLPNGMQKYTKPFNVKITKNTL